MISRKLKWAFSIFFVLAFFVSYALLPYIALMGLFPIYVVKLGQITFIAVLSYLVALNLPTIFDFKLKIPKLALSFDKTIIALFILFFLVVGVIFLSAPTIPIIESLRGADTEDLTEYREEFLKGRTGIEASLGYLIGIINGAFIPYMIAASFLLKKKNRFLYAFIFLLYCISFLEKAYFLRLAIPLFFVFFSQSKQKMLFIIKGSLGIFLLLSSMYIFSGKREFTVAGDANFFSIGYLPTGSFESMLWRATVVPVVTALDAVRVFITEFNSEFFYGRTSSFISAIIGGERINFERYLYQVQFGGADTGSANQFYAIEAYINYGLIGVILFSAFIGYIIKISIKKRDIALLSLMPLFLYNLYNAGLIGTLLSNGFAIFFIFVFYVNLKDRNIHKLNYDGK